MSKMPRVKRGTGTARESEVRFLNFYRSSSGALVLDTCASDGDHMSAPTKEGDERRQCRSHLDDESILGSMLGKKVVCIVQYVRGIKSVVIKER